MKKSPPIWFDIFFSSLIAYIVFSVIEIFQPGFISYYFDVNIFLLISLISGIVWIKSKPNISE